MEDEIIIHRQIINHYSRPDLAPQLWNYSSTLANNNNGLYWVEQGEREWEREREEEGGTEKSEWGGGGGEKYQPARKRNSGGERRIDGDGERGG